VKPDSRETGDAVSVLPRGLQAGMIVS